MLNAQKCDCIPEYNEDTDDIGHSKYNTQLPWAAIRIRKISKVWDLYQSVTWYWGYKILKELKKINAGIFIKSLISSFTL